jgi:energy-coupling factor transporter ATP-binding protein EcfA2
MASSPTDDAGNPFSTRHVRPGAIAYLFPDGEDVEGVLARLAAANWRGQIVGPHGSGKSTLLAALLRAIRPTGRRVVFVELHDGQRRLPDDIRLEKIPENGVYYFPNGPQKGVFYLSDNPDCPFFHTLLVIDGYEQLPWWRRWALQRRCRRLGVGLLVTTHRSVGLPEIYRTRIDADLAHRVVAKLLTGRSEVITAEQVDECLQRHGQDLRETLFELYDTYERHRQ